MRAFEKVMPAQFHWLHTLPGPLSRETRKLMASFWSKTPRGAAVLIAYRRLIITDPSGDTEVPIRLFQPENDEGMWICRYEIDWPSQKRSHFAGGVDSFQALILALQMIGAEIYTSAYHKAGSLKWFERYRGMAFLSAVICATCLLAMTRACKIRR
jgi:hypothetical protein